MAFTIDFLAVYPEMISQIQNHPKFQYTIQQQATQKVKR